MTFNTAADNFTCVDNFKFSDLNFKFSDAQVLLGPGEHSPC